MDSVSGQLRDGGRCLARRLGMPVCSWKTDLTPVCKLDGVAREAGSSMLEFVDWTLCF